ncbi:MAG: hypothetical protein ABSD67_00900 [Terracidiphilus sp.]|jgi:hypothetical protein
MKNRTDLLTVSAQAVTFLFAMFGGVLKKIAPPDQVGAGYSVGIASFLALIVLLLITALARTSPSRALLRSWLIAGVLLFLIAGSSSIVYPQLIDSYTYPQDRPLQLRQINASDQYLTDNARKLKSQHSGATAEFLVENFENDQQVWTAAGLERAKRELRLCYLCLVLSLATAIFCLLEANKARVNAETSAPSSKGSS